MSSLPGVQAQYLTRDWVGRRVTASLDNGDRITGTLTGLDVETEASTTWGNDIIRVHTTVTAVFQTFGEVHLPELAHVEEAPA